MMVCEIFASVQGESSYAGLPCVFVRMTGCNLRCSYCDTVYAYSEGREMTEEEIVRIVQNYDLKLVEVTGGEPLLQPEVPGLITGFLDLGYTVLVETNGSASIKEVDRRAIVIMDIKTPGSGMSGKMDLGNLDCLKGDDEVKFVIAGRADYEWAKEFIETHRLAGRCTILLSPVFGMLPPEDLARWIIDDRLRVRLNLQIHKYLYGPDARGV